MKKTEETKKFGRHLKFPLALVALLLLVSITYASFGEDFTYDEETTGAEKVEYIFSSEESGQSKFVDETWGDFDNWGWFSISIFAVFISILIFGMVYAIGYAIGARGLQRYALSEMLQVAATAIMIIALIGLLIGAFDMISQFFGGMVTCQGEQIFDPIRADMCRTSEMLDVTNSMYQYAYGAAHSAEMRYSLTMTLFGFPIYMGSMVGEIHKEAETLQYIAHVCTELMFFLTAKMYLLKYIQENMLQFFLPLGLVLRTFHFTRGIGAFFISIAIAFYFIYPTIVFIMDTSYAATSSVPEMPEIIVSGMCNLPMFGSFSFGSAATSQNSITSQTLALTMSSNLSSFLSGIFTHLLYSSMVGFAIALTFMRFATTILGGDTAPFMAMVGRLV